MSSQLTTNCSDGKFEFPGHRRCVLPDICGSVWLIRSPFPSGSVGHLEEHSSDTTATEANAEGLQEDGVP